MADNFNINTTQEQANEGMGLERDNPAMTYVDFGNQIVRNAQEQARQAQLVQQAIEQTKQQKLGTKQKTAADELGVNPELKDVFTIPEAVAYLKAGGVDEDNINAFTTALGDQQTVSKAAVDTIIRKKENQMKFGQPFIATEEDAKNSSMVTKEGDQLIAGQSYFDTGEKDKENNAVYGHGGKEPVDQEAKLHLKESESADKQWQKLDTEMNKFIRSSRGNALTQAAQRAVRALNELGEGQPLTPQVLSFIQKDMSGIFQGGVPPVTGMDAEDFTTIYQKLQGMIQKYTGVSGALFHHDIGNQRPYLLGLLMRLRDSTSNMLKSALASEASGYQTIIDGNPDRWKTMIQGKIDATNAGLSQNAQTTIDAMKETPAGNLPPAMTPKGTAAPAAGNVEDKKAALRAKLGI
jgi:hypothetical protein